MYGDISWMEKQLHFEAAVKQLVKLSLMVDDFTELKLQAKIVEKYLNDNVSSNTK